jgi:hypothetical protein
METTSTSTDSEGHPPMTEPTPLDEQKQSAIRCISDSIGKHQFVKRDGLPGFTCRNHICAAQGTIFLTLKNCYDHQAIVVANDLLSSLRFDRGWDLRDAGVVEEDMDEDFTYSVLTDILDAEPAGRSYADRRAREEARSRDGFSTIEEFKAAAASAGTAPLAVTAAGSAILSIPGIEAYGPARGSAGAGGANALFARFLTAPATGEAQPGSAMAAANAAGDALAPARAEMLSQLQERYGKAAK